MQLEDIFLLMMFHIIDDTEEDDCVFKISAHIYSELKDNKIVLKKLEVNEREKIVDSIKKKYIDSSLRGSWLWERFIQYAALSDDMAWNYIKDFVKNSECIMFFNQEEEKEMFYIQSGNDLNYLLSETYGFEFYITDKKCSYLLCFSHHNILYGCGSAEKWINDIRTVIKSK